MIDMIDAKDGESAVARAGNLAETDEALHVRVRSEYLEMPGMSLTLAQAARLFNLERTHCARVLDALVVDGALWTNGREFLRRSAGRRAV